MIYSLYFFTGLGFVGARGGLQSLKISLQRAIFYGVNFYDQMVTITNKVRRETFS